MCVDFLDGSGGTGSLLYDHIHWFQLGLAVFQAAVSLSIVILVSTPNWEHRRLFFEKPSGGRP